jgi:transcriptional regulator with XRE-family HTH domain
MMDKRRKPVDKEAARLQRAELYEAIDRGAIGLQEAIKAMRRISRLTQAEFAAHRGVSAKVIKEIERGTANPTVSTLNQIGSFFGLEVTFARSGNMHGKSGATAEIPQHEVDRGASTGSSSAFAMPHHMPAPASWTQHYASLSTVAKHAKMVRPYAAVEEVRDILHALNKMEELVAPSTGVRDALRHIDSAAALTTNKEGVQALENARNIIDTVEKIRQQLEPPVELKKWLQDIDNIQQMLQPLRKFEAKKN